MSDSVQVPEYVTELINKIAYEEKFGSYTITNELGSNVGDGFQSLILKFDIHGVKNDQNDKLSLMCKIPHPNITRRQEFRSDILFDQELHFYEKVLPYFVKFQNERGVYSDDDGFFAFPKCYGSIRHENLLGDHAVVMENMKEKGFKQWNKCNDLDFEHSVIVMKELAKLHAISFAMRDQEPEKFKKFKKMKATFHQELDKTVGLRELQKSHYDRAIRSLDPSETELIERIKALKLTFTDLLEEVQSNTNCEPFGVLLHGDCWINNLLYKYNEEASIPFKVCLIDWQLLQFGSPALDISCFLFCSISPQLRNKHFQDFINIYYNTMDVTLSKLGSATQKLFTYQNLQDQLRQFSKFVMYLGPIMIPAITSDSNKALDFNELAQRTQLLTNDPTANINLDEIFEENEAYKNRMSNMIRDMVRMGYW